MKNLFRNLILSIIILSQVVLSQEDFTVEVEMISFEDLMKMGITSASKFEEKLSETPAPILIITKEDIKNRGYSHLTEILNDIPGFDIIAAHGDVTQLAYARGNRTGSLNERTMILIDGVEHNMLYTQHMAIENDFPLSSIERIEILYGPASAVYGPNAFSGIINIITKSSKSLEDGTHQIFTNIGAGSYDTKFGEVTYIGKEGNFGVTVSYKRYRSERHDIVDEPGYFNKALFGNENIWGPYAKFYPEYKNNADNYSLLTKVNLFELELGYNKFETRHGNGSVYPFDKTLPTVDWKFFRDIYYAKYDKELSDKFILSFYTKYQRGGAGPDAFWAQGWNSGDDFDSQRTVEMLTWKFISSKWSLYQDFIYKPDENWILSGGFKYANGTYQKGYEFGRSDQIGFMPGETDFDDYTLFPQSLGDGLTPGNIFRDSEWGMYVQSKYKSDNEKFILVVGARYDDNDIYGDSFNPRVGATYQIQDNLLIKSNYGTAFQAPAPRNLYGGWGGLSVSANLNPDEIKTFDFSIIHTSDLFMNDITFYYNKIQNSIMQGENLPDKTIYGFEYKANVNIGNLGKTIKNTKLHLNYSYTNATYDEIRSNNSTNRSSDLIGGIAEHKVNLIFDMDFDKYVHFNLRANYVGARPTTISNPIAEVDGFVILNSSIQFKNIIHKNLIFFVSVYNLLDKEYFHPGYDSASAGENISKPSLGWYSSRAPQPGRNVLFGIKLDI